MRYIQPRHRPCRQPLRRRQDGGTLLKLVQAHDLVDAAERPRARGWLRTTLPRALAENPSAAFTVDIIETFFEMLPDVYPDDASRRRVGVQLGTALKAECASVAPSANAARDQLIECSRLTSVLPFQIIETLAEVEYAHATRLPGRGSGRRCGGSTTSSTFARTHATAR